ncbi:MAG: CADD family putative folate metabolism protein [Bdellovibrionia bacterium]
MFSDTLTKEISSYHLLGHPFYQAWMAGTLTQEQLAKYAFQYAPHVTAFPRFVSAVHAQAENPVARKMLMENLVDEEGANGATPHPELWRRFSERLGADVRYITLSDVQPKARELVEKFHHLCRSSYEEGLGALYAYEYQVPEVARSKTEGLKKFYGIEKGEATEFFDVHESADRYHSEACAHLLNELTPAQQEKAMAAAKEASVALWDFLTETLAA